MTYDLPYVCTAPLSAGGAVRVGWVMRRDVVVLSAHTRPVACADRTEYLGNGWVCVELVHKGRRRRAWRRIIATVTLADADITLCLLDKPFPKWVKPIGIARSLPTWIEVIHSWRTPQRFKVVPKSGYNTLTGMLYPQPDQNKPGGRPGDSGALWRSKYLRGWRAAGHTRGADERWLYGPCYPHFRKRMMRACRELRKKRRA